MSRSRRSPAPPSVPISEGRHPLLDPPPQGGGGKASHHAEGIASSGQQPPAPPLKCYLCSRSKVLPMFQVEHRQADEGAVLAMPLPASSCGFATLCLRGKYNAAPCAS